MTYREYFLKRFETDSGFCLTYDLMAFSTIALHLTKIQLENTETEFNYDNAQKVLSHSDLFNSMIVYPQFINFLNWLLDKHFSDNEDEAIEIQRLYDDFNKFISENQM